MIIQPRMCDQTCEECSIYETKIQSICDEALIYFKARSPSSQASSQASPEAPRQNVVIFDIDGTALDDRRKGRLSNPRGMYRRHDPVFVLYQEVLQLGYSVVFLTGRDVQHEKETRENLHHQGYITYSQLVLCPRSRERDLQLWKESEREKISRVSELVACIGDQPMDVTGQFIGERQFRLPDPPAHQQCCIM